MERKLSEVSKRELRKLSQWLREPMPKDFTFDWEQPGLYRPDTWERVYNEEWPYETKYAGCAYGLYMYKTVKKVDQGTDFRETIGLNADMENFLFFTSANNGDTPDGIADRIDNLLAEE